MVDPSTSRSVSRSGIALWLACLVTAVSVPLLMSAPPPAPTEAAGRAREALRPASLEDASDTVRKEAQRALVEDS